MEDCRDGSSLQMINLTEMNSEDKPMSKTMRKQ